MTMDMYDIPSPGGDVDSRYFTTPSTVTNVEWQTWQKPRGKQMLSILCIGGGGGGGGGGTTGGTGGYGGNGIVVLTCW